MSGGRVELGIGAGWYDGRARGLRHPVPADRRAVRAARGPAGHHHRAVGRRRPARPSRTRARTCRSSTHRRSPSRPSGRGRRSSSAASVRSARPASSPAYADEYNTPFLQPKDIPGMHANIDAACEAVGRDPATVLRSSAVVICCGDGRAGDRPTGDGDRAGAGRAPRERRRGHARRGGRGAGPLRRGRHHPGLPPGAGPDRPRPHPPPRRRGARKDLARLWSASGTSAAGDTRMAQPDLRSRSQCYGMRRLTSQPGRGSGVAEAVVEAAGSALPELDLVGHEPVAAPVRRAGDRVAVPGLGLGPTAFELGAVGDRPALVRRPRTPLASGWPARRSTHRTRPGSTGWTGPTTRTWRSSSSQPKHSAACGLAASSSPLRLW